ncbi:dienelactone hydrolase family protein [Oscillatoria sp. CS-180]|uniref:dienelactone hydrolase family protein n=1 Tax=Oscillatoria sp. CS-180 TaxID=3021720 RepID=UPI00232DA797|nr:dienelactone hydrolase family protein [Oscillatoria sp. CS-180]MDB9527503.1 dienelactone hydrolase family protein [Oscillatoria sp. CS-180]
MLKRVLLVLLTVACLIGLVAVNAKADIVAEPVVYEIDGQPYEGYFAINEGFGDEQPIVLLIHDWNGIGDYEKRRVQMLAERGYAAFAADLYGQGVRPANPEESQAESSKLYSDRPTMRQRLFAGLSEAQSMTGVDPNRVVAMGYCFGGAAVLEFARAGAEIDGFVSFHGSLETPEGQTYEQAQGPILILHGGDDPIAPMSQVAALADELNAAGVDYDMEIYGGVPHSFTVWGASGEATRYDPKADTQSWDTLLMFLDRQIR